MNQLLNALLLALISACGIQNANRESQAKNAKDSDPAGGVDFRKNCRVYNLPIQCVEYTRYGRDKSIVLVPSNVYVPSFYYMGETESRANVLSKQLAKLKISTKTTERCKERRASGYGYELELDGQPIGCIRVEEFTYTIEELCSGPFDNICNVNFQDGNPLNPFIQFVNISPDSAKHK